MDNSTAAEVIGSGDNTVININSGTYQRVLGGTGSNTININGDAAYFGALSGDFFNDPGGSSDTATNHDILNLKSVTSAAQVNPLGLVDIGLDQTNGYMGQAAGYGFEQINLLGTSDLTLENDLWQAGKGDNPVLYISPASALNVAGRQTAYGSLTNNGTLNLDDGTASNELHLIGNYSGHGGTLIMGTALAGDDSRTDKLIVDGNTDGSTYVVVKNAGGSGAQTLNGIELIHVGGQSDGEFVQQGRIVAEIRGSPADERLAVRKERTVPLMQSLYDWVQAQMKVLSRHSDTAKAFAYLLKQWGALNLYCSNGWAEIDNNIAENALRGVALGRKNWLFAGSDAGGERAAILYSLIGTCRLNGVEPEAWLCYVIGHIQDWPVNRLRDLLPWKTDLTSA